MNGYIDNRTVLNKVIDRYIKGIYLNKNGTKERLSGSINQYNKKFIEDIKNINREFFSLMLTERVTIKLMEMSDENHSKETRILWNLMKAHGGTIKFNKLLRNRLFQYAVDKKEIYDNIKKDLDSQYERVGRNKKLVIELLEEYGLKNIIDMIEEENGMTIFEHVSKFLDTKNYMIKDVEDEKEAYTFIRDEYIKYITDLATKNNITINSSVADSLKEYRDRIDKTKKENNAKRKELREQKRKEDALKIIELDNIEIQREITAKSDNEVVRLDYNTSTKLFRAIANAGGKVWYVALNKKSIVSYISENNKITRAISKIHWFINEKDAKKCADSLHDKELGYISVQYINIGIDNQNKADASIDFLNKLFSDSAVSIVDCRIIKKILLNSNGYNSDSNKGSSIIYKAVPVHEGTVNESGSYFIKLEDNNTVTLKDNYNYMSIFSIQQCKENNTLKYIQDIVDKCYGSNKYKVYEHRLNIVSDWYYNKIIELYRHDRLLNEMVHCKNAEELDMYANELEIDYTTLKIFMNNYKEFRSNNSEVYYIYYTSCKYYSTNASKITKSLRNIKFFSSYEEALESYKDSYDSTGAIFGKVFKLGE